MPNALLLFDVDQTLITSHGSGMRAMLAAGREMFGPQFSTESVSFAGRIDPLILHELIAAAGHEPTAERMETFKQTYFRHIHVTLAEAKVHPEKPARTLPGVLELLAELEGNHAGLCRGVLTGNYELSGLAKLRACGIAPEVFTIRVWGDESRSVPPTRNDLPAVGIAKFGEHHSRPVQPSRTVIIGDTPHDVACAHACGCKCLAVATGFSSVDELRRAGADAVVENLGETRRVVEVLYGLTGGGG
jgi:phosphoglycolate phosphatase-like HAD superfamily hydrolase